MLRDRFNRTIDYMRVSVTDRCNLRCGYCVPGAPAPVPEDEVLSFEEIAFICAQAASLGITRFRLTGGEPLAREGCPELVAMLKAIPGVEQLALTTNGVMLKPQLDALFDAGLDAVNISLDSVDREQYAAITGVDALDRVLNAIDAAANRLPVKLNCVVQRGVNEDAPPALALLAKDRPVDVRFIELMPIGGGRALKTVPNEEVLSGLEARFGISVPDGRSHGNGPAVYRRLPGFMGSVGFISAVHDPFCQSCNRLRLLPTGELKPCLCYGDTIPLRDILRDGAPDKAGRIREKLRQAVQAKPRAHCFDSPDAVTERREMVRIRG